MSFESAVSSGYFYPFQHKPFQWDTLPAEGEAEPNSPSQYQYPPVDIERRTSLASEYNPSFNTLNPIISPSRFDGSLPEAVHRENQSPMASSPFEPPKVISRKRSRQLELSTHVETADFPASREPDLICDETHDKCLARTNNLALGMLKILNHYTLISESPKQSSFPTQTYDSLAGSGSNDSHGVGTEHQAQPGMDKIKFDLITTLRNTLPLPHLQKIAKFNNLNSIQWYPCNYPDCFHVYQTRRSLRRHIFVHTGETPHECQFPGCKKAYTAADRLSEHMHTHTNQRPYKCMVEGCSKAYNDAKTLREHKLTHGEKNFLCPVPSCEKNFHRKTHLKQHMRTHANDFVNGV